MSEIGDGIIDSWTGSGFVHAHMMSFRTPAATITHWLADGDIVSPGDRSFEVLTDHCSAAAGPREIIADYLTSRGQ